MAVLDKLGQNGAGSGWSMAQYPALEVMMVSGHGPPAGTRIPITELPLRIGRAPTAASGLPGLGPSGGLLQLSPQVTRNHCEVAFEYGRWWVRDLGGANGTFVRGERVHDAELRHGDCFELGEGVVFRLLVHAPDEHREPQLERALLEQPDEPGRWSVYADWLQERGDPLGERLAQPRDEDRLAWLEPFAGFAARGDVEVEWAFGLPTRVVLRRLSAQRAEVTWEQRLATLVRTRAFSFVRQLELDVGSFDVEPPTYRWAERALTTLGTDALPLLERLVIGPCTLSLTNTERAALAPWLEERRAHRPRFVTTLEDLHRPWGPARLMSGAGQVIPLDPRGRGFGARASTTPDFAVAFAGDRWRLNSEYGRARVNGQAHAWVMLRTGDVIEASEGLSFRFQA